VLFQNTEYKLSLGRESRLSQLAAQFHLNCHNLEGRKVTLKHQNKIISKLSQRLIDVIG
jgi:hypothetical protein